MPEFENVDAFVTKNAQGQERMTPVAPHSYVPMEYSPRRSGRSLGHTEVTLAPPAVSVSLLDPKDLEKAYLKAVAEERKGLSLRERLLSHPWVEKAREALDYLRRPKAAAEPEEEEEEAEDGEERPHKRRRDRREGKPDREGRGRRTGRERDRRRGDKRGEKTGEKADKQGNRDRDRDRSRKGRDRRPEKGEASQGETPRKEKRGPRPERSAANAQPVENRPPAPRQEAKPERPPADQPRPAPEPREAASPSDNGSANDSAKRPRRNRGRGGPNASRNPSRGRDDY